MAGKRIMFTFDNRSFDTLQEMTKEAHYPSLGTTIRDAIRITRTLQKLAGDGYTDVVVRNPITGEERTLIPPELIQPPRA
jgi:hypothetical protein